MMTQDMNWDPVITCSVRLNKPLFFKRIGRFLASMLNTRKTTQYNLPPEMDSRLYL